MPWSYQEDRKLLLGITEGIDRTENAIKQRKRMLAKITSLEQIAKEELFILQNYSSLVTRVIAEKLGLSSTAVSRRIEAMKREGLILKDKRKIYEPTEKPIEIDPMPKKMRTRPIKGLLDRKIVQENKLEVGKTYTILSHQSGDRRSVVPIKTKMTVIGCYPNHYLFTDEKGRKYSLSKVNLAIGEWKYEEVTK